MPNILDEIQLWKADRSAEISLPDGNRVHNYLENDAKVTRRLGGVDELTLTLRAGSKFAASTKADNYHPSQGKIIRLVYDDSSIEEWRIKTLSREFSGEQNPQIRCEPIEQDLKTYTVRKTLANGHARASVSFYNQTFEDIVTRLLSAEYNCPDLFTLGSVASGLSGTTYNLVLNASYIMEGLKKICQLAEAEWGVTYNATNDNYELNFYESGGLGGGESQDDQHPIAMGGGKGNRLTLEKRDETEDYFSRVIPLMGEGPEIQTVADAKWTVDQTYSSNKIVDGTRIILSENPIAKDGYGLIDGKDVYFGNADEGWHQVQITERTSILEVNGDASGLTYGYFREGSNKNDIIFIEDADALDQVGLKEEKYSRPDIPPYANIIENEGVSAAMSDWSSGLPKGMQKIDGAESVSQEGSDLFVTHGSTSVKVECNSEQGLQTVDLDLQPNDNNPYFSTTVYVRVQSGSVRIELVDSDDKIHPNDQLAETNVKETRAIKIGGAEPAAGPAKIKVIAQDDNTVFYLDAITLTQSSYALEYAPQMGAKALWEEAGKHLKKYGGDRPDVWTGEIMDKAFFDSGVDEVEIGSYVKVQEDWNQSTQSYDSEFTVRVVELTYDEDRKDGRYKKTVRLADKNSEASRVFQEQYLTTESQQSDHAVRSNPERNIFDRQKDRLLAEHETEITLQVGSFENLVDENGEQIEDEDGEEIVFTKEDEGSVVQLLQEQIVLKVQNDGKIAAIRMDTSPEEGSVIDISADQVKINNIEFNEEAGTIGSDNYQEGQSGWQIDGQGNAEFNKVEVRNGIVESSDIKNLVVKGIIENADKDYLIDENGFAVKVASSWTPERAYTVVNDNNDPATIVGGLYGNTGAVVVYAADGKTATVDAERINFSGIARYANNLISISAGVLDIGTTGVRATFRSFITINNENGDSTDEIISIQIEGSATPKDGTVIILEANENAGQTTTIEDKTGNIDLATGNITLGAGNDRALKLIYSENTDTWKELS